MKALVIEHNGELSSEVVHLRDCACLLECQVRGWFIFVARTQGGERGTQHAAYVCSIAWPRTSLKRRAARAITSIAHAKPSRPRARPHTTPNRCCVRGESSSSCYGRRLL